MTSTNSMFLLLMFIYAAWGQKPCCLPDQYQASLGQTIANVVKMNTSAATGSLSEGRETFAHDYTNKRVAYFTDLNVTTSQGVFRITSRTIIDYKKSAKWTIKGNSCTVMKLNKNMSSPCIPDNATYIGNLVIGGVLKADQWLVTTADKGGFNYSYTVTSDKCIPIDVTLYSYHPDGLLLETNTFADFIPKIQDPDVFFTVPKNCPKPPINSNASKATTDPKEPLIEILTGEVSQSRIVSIVDLLREEF